MELTIQLQPKQQEALRALSKHPVVLYGGAKGGGKSYLTRAWMLMRRLKYPGTRGLIIRKTFPELLDNHITPYLKEYPELASYYKRQERRLVLPNGSTISFSYLKNTQDVYTYQGREFEDIAIDEITQHSEEAFKIIRSSNRTTNPAIKPRMLLPGNPGGIGHGWVKRIFIDRQFRDGENPEDFGFVAAKVYDNVALMAADPDYLKRLEGLPEQQRKAYLDGSWDVFAGQYFNEWEREIHVVEPRPINPNFEHFIGLDYGHYAPSAVYWGESDYDGNVTIYREFYTPGLTYKELANEILARTPEPVKYLVVDPSLESKEGDTGLSGIELIYGEFIKADRRIPIIPANNDRLNGWRVFHEYLKPDPRPALQVFSNCLNAIRTIPELIHDDIKPEDVDTDGEDHAADSIRYMLMSRPPLPKRADGLNKPIITMEDRLNQINQQRRKEAQQSQDTQAWL